MALIQVYILMIVLIFFMCPLLEASMKIESYIRMKSFSKVEDALPYLGPNPDMSNSRYVAECADMCVKRICNMFLYHRNTNLCIPSFGKFLNGSTGMETQQNQNCYNLYQSRVKVQSCRPEIVPLEMGSRDIPDCAITVSDEYVTARLTKNNSRLNIKGEWSTPHNRGSLNHNYWISVVLNGQAVIHQVATQRCIMCMDKWVEQYSIQYSVDGNTWATYKENDTKKIFIGNTIEYNTVYGYFTPPIVASHFRLCTEKLSVISLNGIMSAVGTLRMELYGCYT